MVKGLVLVYLRPRRAFSSPVIRTQSAGAPALRTASLALQDAARQLGISRQAYYKWERRALRALLHSLEDQPRGRPPSETDPVLNYNLAVSTVTVAPACVSAEAISRPIPRPPPVTSAWEGRDSPDIRSLSE